jgi:hypothetical protein
MHPWLRPYDLTRNAVRTYSRERGTPHDQLRRFVFENCRSFSHALRVLETTPVARPVIFSLAGVRRNETCVVERTETECTVRFEHTCAANDWHVARPRWEARVAGDMALTCRYHDAAANSRARSDCLAGWTIDLDGTRFGWVVPPVLNRFTRLAVETRAATGVLRVQGYEFDAGEGTAAPATYPCTIEGMRRAA